MGFKRLILGLTSAIPLGSLLSLGMVRVVYALGFRWYVSASSYVTGFAWIACSYVLPDQAAKGCIAAALLFGANVFISAHGGSGQYTADISPVKRDPGTVQMIHWAEEGAVYDFVNTIALTYDWHFVHAVDQPMNVTVRRLPDGRIHAWTQGFSLMECGDSGEQCPETTLQERSNAVTYSTIEELDFSFSEPSGYGTKSQTWVSGAASGAAGFVVGEPQGTYSFCSNALTVNNLNAEVAFNFSPRFRVFLALTV
ncbi:uncharacterized protein N7484_007507 [Penicillium longicatenatum]|uniref:uncharacterized protein n=1 Tax=Penicillium longicatenatum TaxID=1561947 RepID=UPI002546BADE|nr:uncharacterized protein N7484_007507 [Penicillium longicatenatum]KAJ5639645.1 hypothetical protein N7484_007507 [Penicillium longicatenatum]